MNIIIDKSHGHSLDVGYSIDNYITTINMKCEKDGCKKREKENEWVNGNDGSKKKGKKTNKKMEKIDDDTPTIPKMEEYEMIYENNY